MSTLNGAVTARVTASATFGATRIPKAVTGFPYKKLGVKVELLVNTTWTDITAYVMLRDDISISPIGRTDETSQMQPGQMTLTLKNTDGRFTTNNASGAYYPYIQLNTQMRLSVTDTSANGTAYSGYRFWGEVSEWPTVWDNSGRDVSETVTVSGIWRRLSQATSTATIGSPFTRWNKNLNTTIAGYWPMEDGATSTTYAAVAGTADPMTIVVNTPTNASCVAFPGSDAIPQLNGAELSGLVHTSASPTQVVFRFCLFVQSGGDTGVAAGPLARIHFGANTNLSYVDVSLAAAGGGPFTITGFDSSNNVKFTSNLSQSIWGIPLLVQVGLVKSGSNVIWSLNTIIPGTTTWAGTTTGTVTGASITDVSSVIFSPGAQWKGVSVGQAMVMYGNPSIIQDASALSGWRGEDAAIRFTRICTEQGIPCENIGGTSGTFMGPQIDDTLVNVLQDIEDTDGGLIYETRDQLGLGYRTMNSLQNQASALTLDYPSAQLDPSLAPVNDDSLVRNDVTLANYDGYSVRVYLANGARSLNPPPNGVGSGYEFSQNVNSTSHAQVNALGSQILNCGCTFQNRYPAVTVNLARVTTASLFNKVPSMRIGDYLQITNMPSFMGGGTEKQLVWGWTETISDTAHVWKIAYNTIPEAPWESSFNPGTSATGQVPGSPVTASQSGSVSGAQIAEGAIIGSNVAAGTLQGSNIANATITATNIAAATITGTLIGTGQITGTNIAAGTIEGTNIDSATITGANIASATIAGSNIANATITTTQISGSAGITGSQIGSATITGGNLANATITATQIANATITGAQVATGTITSGNIQNATITGTDIASGTITASNITNATITNVQIAAGSITGSNIGSSTITGANLTNATITSVQIANGTITTTQISNSAAITGTQVASGTITAANIAANTITAGQIAASTITTTQIAANTIQAGDIQAGIVLAGAVNGTTITGANFVADGSTGQILIYSGTPEAGNLIGSWSGLGGTDGFGNMYPSGLSVQQGAITGLDIDSTTVTNSDWEGGSLNNPIINNPQLTGGTITETNIVFDQVDGNLLVYASTTTTATITTAGTGTWTVPAGVTQAKIETWGAGQGGDGGKTTGGGNGGIGGSYACEPIYSIPIGTGTIGYTVGIAGTGGFTGAASHGANGGDTLFGGINGVHSIGGNNSGYGPYNTINHAGGAGGATPSSSGGSSGGNSGTPTATGNAGIKATTSTHAGAPTAQTGSGQGAPGGDVGSNANTAASSPGGGGGGAGEGTANNLTITYNPTWVGSYYGPDASSGANSLRSSTTLYQGISSRGGGATSGNQRALMRFNSSQIFTDFATTTGYQAFLNITNLSTAYSQGMMVEISYCTSLQGGTQLTTYPTGATVTHAVDWFVPAGATVAIPLGLSVCSSFGGNTIDTLVIGADVPANYAGVQDWQGYFAANVTLTMQAKPSSSSKSGSNGGTGQIAITYTSGQTLIGAISPTSGTDSLTNAFGAGFTGQIAAIQPATNPTAVETWHNVLSAGLLNSWTVGSGGIFRYKLMPDNTVMIQMANISGGATANPTSIWNIPAGYRSTVAASQNFPIDVGTASTASAITPSVYVDTGSNTLKLQNAQSSLVNFSVTIRYALD